MAMRTSGVLLPIFSLPGPFSVGCFGNEAVDFARMLRDMGFTYWQILPLGPPAAGDSPYQCYSAFAGNPLMIDLRQLADQGLLTAGELAEAIWTGSPHVCDYEAAARSHQEMMRLAFSRYESSGRTGLDEFIASDPTGIRDFALFLSIRSHYAGLSWHLWPDENLRNHDPAALDRFMQEHQQEIRFNLFGQYEFFRQWDALRAEINSLGIRIVGDLPIYVGYDSCDVWADRHQFELDTNNLPIEVAGVPPDYFTEDGQLWGNPLYDWAAMNQDGFSWWVRRIQESFRLYDVVRLDHFRGFVNYWAVPAGETTARNGHWRTGPGAALFKAIRAQCPDADLIAEDLGASDDGSVAAFLLQSGLPGMRVLQFGFGTECDSEHLPHNHTANCVAYTSTHDNTTLLGWLYGALPEERRFGLDYVGLAPDCRWGEGGPHAPVIRAFLRTLWQSCASRVIVPVQDMLGYGADTRINIPGHPTGQWRWRASHEDLLRIDQAAFKALNHTYRRENPELKTAELRENQESDSADLYENQGLASADT